MKTVSGVFIFNEEDRFLIIHRTGKISIEWTIPTGTLREDMTGEEVVRDKLYKLCNIGHKQIEDPVYVGTENNPYGNIRLEAYQTKLRSREGKINLKCNKIVDDAVGRAFDAIDEYQWVNFDYGRRFLPPHQVKLLEIINDANL